MDWSNVEQMDVIALFRQPGSVAAWAAADIKDDGRWRRQKSLEKLAGTFSIKDTRAFR
jgi:hypothetical protein